MHVLEIALVVLILAGALTLLARRVSRALSGRESSCGCSCSCSSGPVCRTGEDDAPRTDGRPSCCAPPPRGDEPVKPF